VKIPAPPVGQPEWFFLLYEYIKPITVSNVISSGAIEYVTRHMTVDTESSAATDDLDTISGGVSGDRCVIQAADSARTVVCKDGTGNLALAGDFSLDNAEDTIELIFNGTNWCELSRSNNGA
jgi:hypothetical protein